MSQTVCVQVNLGMCKLCRGAILNIRIFLSPTVSILTCLGAVFWDNVSSSLAVSTGWLWITDVYCHARHLVVFFFLNDIFSHEKSLFALLTAWSSGLPWFRIVSSYMNWMLLLPPSPSTYAKNNHSIITSFFQDFLCSLHSDVALNLAYFWREFLGFIELSCTCSVCLPAFSPSLDWWLSLAPFLGGVELKSWKKTVYVIFFFSFVQPMACTWK